MRRAARLAAQAVLPALILAGAALATLELVSDAPQGPAGGAPRAEAVYAVAATTIRVGDHRATLRAFGEVVAADLAELRVASPGEVIEVAPALAVGEVVKAGAPLVTIDPFLYRGALREARAELAEARARREEADARVAMERAAVARVREQLELAERDVARAEQLLKTGTITDKALDERRLLVSQRQQALDQRSFTLTAEEARRAQHTAQIERLEWAVERAGRALADTVLRAPFDGIVRFENVALGRILAANDIAVTLIRADTLEVRFVVSDQRYGRLVAGGSLLGAPVTVTWRIGDVPLTYDAVVTRVAADIASDTGGVDVFARLALPPDGPAPRPGAFVEVSVPGPVHPGSVRLPASALYGTDVFVIGADDRLDRRTVRRLSLDGEEVIVSGPLTAGEVVVTTRLAEAGDGIRVRRVDGSDGANADSASGTNGTGAGPRRLPSGGPAAVATPAAAPGAPAAGGATGAGEAAPRERS